MAKQALVVGVERYHDPKQLPKVSCAKDDALAMREALLDLGYDTDDVVLLIDDQATKATVEKHVDRVAKYAVRGEQILLYFAGHGLFHEGANYLATVDKDTLSVETTAVQLGNVLATLEGSSCKSVMVFLDCCHSGLRFETGFRGSSADFSYDELKYRYGDSEFLAVFSACQKDEKSWSSPADGHGIWTLYLLRALKGEAESLYESGLLFSDRLQSYLREQTSTHALTKTAKKRPQTPVKFGRETERFIVADVSPIFARRIAESSASGKYVNVERLTISSEESGYVRHLPGFRGNHHVPKEANGYTQSFVKKIAEDLVRDDIARVCDHLRAKAGYKFKDFGETEEDAGYRSLSARGFDYTVSVEQDENEPSEYIITRVLENFENNEALTDDGVNAAFDGVFDTFSLITSADTDIEALITAIEDLPPEAGISVDYDMRDLSRCTVSSDAFDGEIVVTKRSVEIVAESKLRPKLLLQAYTDARLALGGSGAPLLLE